MVLRVADARLDLVHGGQVILHRHLDLGAGRAVLLELALVLLQQLRQLRRSGARGLGGLTTVLDVKINMYPTHAASKPVAMIPNCAATRHAHFVLDGSGPTYIEPPKLSDWPDVSWKPDTEKSKRVNLDTLTKEEVASWTPGQTLLLNGKMLTGRDAAHKRIQDMLAKGEQLPVDFKNRVIYYVGPVDPVRDEVVGPAGPTTATRMDKFTDMMLEQTGLIAMIGKAERGPTAIESIKKHKSAYLMAVGGSAYLVSKAIKSAKVLGFEDMGMEAIYEFEVEDMPVTVAVDAGGTSVHNTGPKEWAARIEALNHVIPTLPFPTPADAPIGVFDSGVGGLSVLRHIRALLPQEHLIYFADSGFAPYGDKTEAVVVERSLAVAAFLVARGVKALVVACNTATVAAIKAIRAHHPALPV
eukprot:gene38007-46905_t